MDEALLDDADVTDGDCPDEIVFFSETLKVEKTMSGFLLGILQKMPI